jgi:hypothetical protein
MAASAIAAAGAAAPVTAWKLSTRDEDDLPARPIAIPRDGVSSAQRSPSVPA